MGAKYSYTVCALLIGTSIKELLKPIRKKLELIQNNDDSS